MPFAAGLAGPRIDVGVVRVEEMGAQRLIQRVKHLADPQVLGFIDGATEGAPEILQNLLPISVAGGDVIKGLLERRREVVFHVTREEIAEKRGDQTAPVVGYESGALEAHIVAILQDRDDTGVS